MQPQLATDVDKIIVELEKEGYDTLQSLAQVELSELKGSGILAGDAKFLMAQIKFYCARRGCISSCHLEE